MTVPVCLLVSPCPLPFLLSLDLSVFFSPSLYFFGFQRALHVLSLPALVCQPTCCFPYLSHSFSCFLCVCVIYTHNPFYSVVSFFCLIICHEHFPFSALTDLSGFFFNYSIILVAWMYQYLFNLMGNRFFSVFFLHKYRGGQKEVYICEYMKHRISSCIIINYFIIFHTNNCCIFLTTAVFFYYTLSCVFFEYFAVVHGAGLFKTVKSAFCLVLWHLLEFP